MINSSPHSVVQIKKYPNRRYYDATHSRHVTLHEVHDAIVAGHDVCVTDSRTGDDITNLVLTQILLERDEPKLDLFPSAILHLMIRSNRQVLRSWMERSFGPFLDAFSSSQKQFDAYLRQAMQAGATSPLDWANRMMQAFTGTRAAAPRREPVDPGAAPASEASPDAIAELKRQLEELQRRMDELQQHSPKSDKSRRNSYDDTGVSDGLTRGITGDDG
jgi:polyhydroxyalkanoate synthesis repressor PhaR